MYNPIFTLHKFKCPSIWESSSLMSAWITLQICTTTLFQKATTFLESLFEHYESMTLYDDINFKASFHSSTLICDRIDLVFNNIFHSLNFINHLDTSLNSSIESPKREEEASCPDFSYLLAKMHEVQSLATLITPLWLKNILWFSSNTGSMFVHSLVL